eukprot:3102209-Rhodomonas_salina.1
MLAASFLPPHSQACRSLLALPLAWPERPRADTCSTARDIVGRQSHEGWRPGLSGGSSNRKGGCKSR